MAITLSARGFFKFTFFLKTNLETENCVGKNHVFKIFFSGFWDLCTCFGCNCTFCSVKHFIACRWITCGIFSGVFKVEDALFLGRIFIQIDKVEFSEGKKYVFAIVI